MKSIRTFVLAALVTAALAALPAAASASGGFVADEYPATLSGSESTDSLSFGYGTKAVVCEGATAPSVEATLDHPSPTVTTDSIEVGICAGGTAFYPEDCQLELQPDSGTVDIVSSGCGPAKVNLGAPCGMQVLSVPAQTGIEAEYENVGSGSSAGVKVTIDDSGLEYTSSGGLCGKQTLSIDATLNLTATDAGGSPIGASVLADDLPHGLFLAGGPGEGEPRLASLLYPTQVTGERFQLGEVMNGQLTLLEVSGKKVSCSAGEFDGGELSGPAYGEFSLSAAYSGCKIAAFNANVAMSGCEYAYSDLEQTGEDVYASAAAIVCGEGSEIKVTGAGCTLKIPAQTLAGGEGTVMANIEEGYDSTVGMMMTASGVKYTASGLCPLAGFPNGTYSNANHQSDVMLHGVLPG